MKDVALYIPCFNAEKTIGACLDAVLGQTYPVREVIVVDDGSTDRTVSEASKYKVRVVRHAKNEGLAGARNSAIQAIDAEYVASVDSDCQPDNDWLSGIMSNFDSGKIAGCGGKLIEYHRDDVCDRWRSIHMRQYWNDDEKDPPFLFGSNTVFRRQALCEVGLYNARFTGNYEDVDISQRLKNAGYSLMFVPAAVVRHLRKDTVRTVLNNFWGWNSFFYQQTEFYSNAGNFALKIKDNIGLANRFVDEDVKSGNDKIIYLDFLLAIHHSLKDYIFFTGNDTGSVSPVSPDDRLAVRLSLLDLTFFYHFDKSLDTLRTLMPGRNAFFQNLFALDLILSNVLRGKFRSNDLRKKIFGDILASISDIRDDVLLDRLCNLSELHQDWSGFVKKGQANINAPFLGVLSEAFTNWTDSVADQHSDIFLKIEESAKGVMP